MKRSFLPMLAGVLVFGALVVGCGDSKAESEPAAKKQNLIAVRTDTIRLQNFSEPIKLTGTIQSINDIVVPAEESGRLTKWFVEKGSSVSKGQVMAQIDDAMLKSAYEAADANFKMAEVNYEKQKRAFEEQAISELQLKNLEYQRDAARAQADAARQRLEKTKIKAPVDGVINERFADEGEMIGAGMPAAQVVDIYQVKIVLGVPERYSAELKIGSPAEFTVDAYPDERFQGRINFVAPSVNADNRTIPTEISVANTRGMLKPNMIARVTLKLATAVKSIVIPMDCIQQIDLNRSVVYVAKNGLAEERVVRLGGSDGSRVQILQGLQPGDELIVTGFQNLVDQQKILIQP
ncbi:MAG: efflux RND transporter periplasmic adaptor subunit [Bacteroidetes bacterium]|nr:efflux RND transporter periplasmic adaptor subunit [Bacteroidota bacterium]